MANEILNIAFVEPLMEFRSKNEHWIQPFHGKQVDFYVFLFVILGDDVGLRPLSNIPNWRICLTRHFQDPIGKFKLNSSENNNFQIKHPNQRLLKNEDDTMIF
jgi:hypothetical protein